MAGCFGDDPEDRWKENLALEHTEYYIEEDKTEFECKWCKRSYALKDSENIREPEDFCSASCATLFYSDGEY